MERFIANLVKDFDSGKLDRREFCQSVALAAPVYASGEAANAQASRGFKVLGINHISYQCPDYAKARDWYSSVLGMQVAPGREAEQRANLMFGPDPGKGGSFMVVRNAPAQPKPPSRPAPRTRLRRLLLLSGWGRAGRLLRNFWGAMIQCHSA